MHHLTARTPARHNMRWHYSPPAPVQHAHHHTAEAVIRWLGVVAFVVVWLTR